MTENEIKRLRTFLEINRMESSLGSLVINLQNDKYTYYTTPELSENMDKTHELIYNILKKSSIESEEIDALLRMINDYAYYKSRMYYEYGFKAGADFYRELKTSLI